MKIRRLVSAVAVALLAGALTPAIPAAQAATPAPALGATLVPWRLAAPCGDFFFVGAAGGGEEPTDADLGMGSTVYSTLSNVVAQVPGRRITYTSVENLTTPVWDLTELGFERYFTSPSYAQREAQTMIVERHQVCPTERVILAGYSQGARAMHQAYHYLFDGYTLPWQALGAMVLISDPMRIPEDASVRVGSAPATSFGVATPNWKVKGHSSTLRDDYSGWAPKPLTGPVAGRTISVCQANDIVCDTGNGWLPGTPATGNEKGTITSSQHTFVEQADGLQPAYRQGDLLDATVEHLGAVLRQYPPAEPSPLIIKAAMQHRGQVGLQVQTWARAYGGVLPYRWSATGLPAGVRVNATTGSLSGAPTQAGRFEAVLRVTDGTGRHQYQALEFTISPRLGTLREVHWPRFASGGLRVLAVSSDARWALIQNSFPAASTQTSTIMVYDLRTGTITRRLSALDDQGSPDSRQFSWSPDGRYLVFASTKMLGGSTTKPGLRVWRYDRVADRYQVVTRDPIQPIPSAGGNVWPVISGNNQYVFSTTVERACGRDACTWRQDLATGKRLLAIAVDLAPGRPEGYLVPNQVSADGSTVALAVNAGALTTGARKRYSTLMVKNVTTGVLSKNRPYYVASTTPPSLSADGTTVGYDNGAHAMAWKGAPRRISTNVQGWQGGSASFGTQVAYDGQTVTFFSRARLMSTPMTPGSIHLYRVNLADDTWQVLDVDPSGLVGTGSATRILNTPTTSTAVLLKSLASNLGPSGRPGSFLWSAG